MPFRTSGESNRVKCLGMSQITSMLCTAPTQLSLSPGHMYVQSDSVQLILDNCSLFPCFNYSRISCCLQLLCLDLKHFMEISRELSDAHIQQNVRVFQRISAILEVRISCNQGSVELFTPEQIFDSKDLLMFARACKFVDYSPNQVITKEGQPVNKARCVKLTMPEEAHPMSCRRFLSVVAIGEVIALKSESEVCVF